MLIPGEALSGSLSHDNRWSPVLQRIHVQRALRATVVRLSAYLALVVVTAWAVTWWTESPTIDNTCIQPPEGPTVDYRGFDGAWTVNGHVIGYTPAEDSGCLSPNPI